MTTKKALCRFNDLLKIVYLSDLITDYLFLNSSIVTHCSNYPTNYPNMYTFPIYSSSTITSSSKARSY